MLLIIPQPGLYRELTTEGSKIGTRKSFLGPLIYSTTYFSDPVSKIGTNVAVTFNFTVYFVGSLVIIFVL